MKFSIKTIMLFAFCVSISQAGWAGKSWDHVKKWTPIRAHRPKVSLDLPIEQTHVAAATAAIKDRSYAEVAATPPRSVDVGVPTESVRFRQVVKRVEQKKLNDAGIQVSPITRDESCTTVPLDEGVRVTSEQPKKISLLKRIKKFAKPAAIFVGFVGGCLYLYLLERIYQAAMASRGQQTFGNFTCLAGAQAYEENLSLGTCPAERSPSFGTRLSTAKEIAKPILDFVVDKIGFMFNPNATITRPGDVPNFELPSGLNIPGEAGVLPGPGKLRTVTLSHK